MYKTQGFRVELQVSGGGVTGKGQDRDEIKTRQGQDRDKTGTRQRQVRAKTKKRQGQDKGGGRVRREGAEDKNRLVLGEEVKGGGGR